MWGISENFTRIPMTNMCLTMCDSANDMKSVLDSIGASGIGCTDSGSTGGMNIPAKLPGCRGAGRPERGGEQGAGVMHTIVCIPALAGLPG